MSRIVSCWEFQSKLLKALRLSDRAVRRIVIDVQPDEAVHVYIQEFLTDDQEQPLLNVLAGADEPVIARVRGLDVDEKGNVRHNRQSH